MRLKTTVGWQAGIGITTGSHNTAVGYNTLSSTISSGANCAFGRDALSTCTANQNSAFGYSAGRLVTSGTYNNFFGSEICTGAYFIGNQNVAMGYQTFYTPSSGDGNTCIGTYAGYSLTTGSYNTFLGINAGRSTAPGGAFTTQSNRVVIGDNNITNAYIVVAWTVTSDARDKADVVDTKYGLNFINELRPVEFKWDKRSKYENWNPDGTLKETKSQIGFLAQDVIKLEKQYGAVAKDLLIADDENDETLGITETKLIPVLVKAIQELTARITQLETR